MKYPNIKPQQGEQTDINQRRYDEDTIEIANEPGRMTPAQERQDEFDDPGETVRNAPATDRKGKHV